MQLEEETEIDTSPTKEELSLADEIISQRLNRAIARLQRSHSEIWTEFGAVRARLASSASNQDTMNNQ